MKNKLKVVLRALFRLPRKPLETYLKTQELLMDMLMVTPSMPSKKQLEIYGLHALRHLLTKGYSFTEIENGEFIKDIKRKGEV